MGIWGIRETHHEVVWLYVSVDVASVVHGLDSLELTSNYNNILKKTYNLIDYFQDRWERELLPTLLEQGREARA